MSFSVRVAGPEFQDDRNRDAFARIEESIRQYSTHSRETFAVIRGPLELDYDHFILIWSRGSALVGLFPYGGRIRGGASGRWVVEEPLEHSVSETTVENPYEILVSNRDRVVAALKPIRPVAAGVIESDLALEERRPPALKLVAVFTGMAQDIHLDENLRDPLFEAVSLEYALSRTMFHMPNLLRLTDREALVYNTVEIETLSEQLEGWAETEHRAITTRATKLQSFRRARQRRPPRSFSYVWLAAAATVLIVLYVILRPLSPTPEAPTTSDTTSVKSSAPVRSTIVIRLPVETQLFVSPEVFESRSELDNALSHGAGIRYLPDTTQIVQLDSSAFAKGVYGYFKVENVWRKGKLLQTFKSSDTILVDNFLEPLK